MLLSWNLWIHIPIDCSGFFRLPNHSSFTHVVFQFIRFSEYSTIYKATFHMCLCLCTCLCDWARVKMSINFSCRCCFRRRSFEMQSEKNLKTLHICGMFKQVPFPPSSDIQTVDLKEIGIDWTLWHRHKSNTHSNWFNMLGSERLLWQVPKTFLIECVWFKSNSICLHFHWWNA